MKQFSNIEAVRITIQNDLEKAYEMPVSVQITPPPKTITNELAVKEYTCIDNLDIECEFDRIDKSKLFTEKNNIVNERLVSHLLKSNCLVTNQPDWGSLFLEYSGPKINHEGLLKYIITYRNHNGFHEHCVEQCFADIIEICKPNKIILHAQYTRRGGLDINPVRSNIMLKNFSFNKTFRQ